jgi:hypothetical protein
MSFFWLVVECKWVDTLQCLSSKATSHGWMVILLLPSGRRDFVDCNRWPQRAWKLPSTCSLRVTINNVALRVKNIRIVAQVPHRRGARERPIDKQSRWLCGAKSVRSRTVFFAFEKADMANGETYKTKTKEKRISAVWLLIIIDHVLGARERPLMIRWQYVFLPWI